MALAFALNIEVIRDDPQGEQWEEALEPGGMSGLLIRLPGTSRSGPCMNCMQYFHMHHDGTGNTVPIRPLHARCVCRDIPVELNELMGGPKERKIREWMELDTSLDALEKSMGKGKFNTYLRLKATLPKEERLKLYYSTTEAPNKNAVSYEEMIKRLQKLPKRELLRLARGMRGIELPKSPSRDELISRMLEARFADSRHIINRRTLESGSF